MTKLHSSLYPYQKEDVLWLEQHQRCILGSDMGVGKTFETLALAAKLDFTSILVVCPKSLIAEWEYQIEHWLGKDWIDKFVVLNYEKLRQLPFVNKLNEYHWDLIVFDECHKLKNYHTKQTRGATLISNNGSRIILVSGTPMQNGPQDLFSLLRIVDRTKYTSYWNFVERYCIIQQLPVPPFPRVVVGARNKEELRKELHSVMLRRTKSEVLPQLPPKTFRTIPVQLEGRQLEQYKQMEDKLFVLLDSGEKITAPVVIAQIIRLRQICLEPNLLSEHERVSSPSIKTQLILELLEQSDGPIVIYTYFENYTRILSAELTKAKVRHALYTGRVKSEDRYQVVKDFQAGKYRALIGTLTTMGLGLTLTKSHTIIFADLWFNPAANAQAVDRLHRIGQTEPVQVIDLWAKKTVEDAMHRTLQRKEKMFSEIVATEYAIEELRRMRQGGS